MRLIYLSPVPWNSFSQRPHELIRYFNARTGGQVLWIDPYPTRLPALSDFLSRHKASFATEDKDPNWITVVRPKALPIEPLPFSGKLNGLLWRTVASQVNSFADESTVLGIGKPSELALQLLSWKCFKSSFYDAMDDFPAFYNGWSSRAMARREHKTVRQVTTVLTSSSILQQRLRPFSRDVRLVLNACASSRLPKPYRSRAEQMPVIGYVGTIGHWFDWELVLALSAEHPDAKFRLIGPLYEKPLTILPSNIVIEPPLPHDEALRAMTQFDVGLIPFKKTTLTSSVDPIKYYEYRALGLPVVSSAFGEMALRGEQEGVWLIGLHSNMRAVIGQAMEYRSSTPDVRLFRESNSWERRFDQADIF